MTGRSLSLAVILLLALSFSSSAQSRLQEETAQYRGTSAPVSTLAADRLLYALPAAALDGLEHHLDFVVLEDEVMTLKESVAFTIASNTVAGQPVVEILPLHPQFLARLRGDGDEKVRISVYLDAALLGDDGLAELRRKSGELQREPLYLVNVRRRAEAGEKDLRPLVAALTGPGCVQQCQQALWTCDSYCLSRPRPSCEENCDTRYYTCLQNCGCPVLMSTGTTTTFLGYTLVSPTLVCLSSSNYYQQYTGTYKNERYQIVMGCDGLQTRTVVSVDYSYTSCWKWAYSGPCIPNQNYPPIEQLCIIK